MKSGIVRLLNKREVVIEASFYKSTLQWKRVVSSWHKVYGPAMQEYAIQFCPDPPKEEIDLLIPLKKTKARSGARAIGGGISTKSIRKFNRYPTDL